MIGLIVLRGGRWDMVSLLTRSNNAINRHNCYCLDAFSNKIVLKSL
jgi:hypothetical protein